MPTILLFDVDGTLVTTDGVGRRAIEEAFERRHGRRDVVSFSFAGMTDKAIARDGLLALGKRFACETELQAEMDATLAFYLRVLEEEAAAAPAGGIRVHDGIMRALDLAEARPEVALGLGTGNLREGARIKLGHAGIYHRFTFGGFADDSIDRPEILASGARRGAAQLGKPLQACRVVVVGDTPKDIDAARAIGAMCVAVATGMHSVAELEAHAPTLACATLADPRADAVLFGD
ncbi:MAG TPA: HAD family hydrolase [Polyangia bacterium]|jgi:Predicted phosphatases|nr:HAD family hydrolase [Polyangia bacterium]